MSPGRLILGNVQTTRFQPVRHHKLLFFSLDLLRKSSLPPTIHLPVLGKLSPYASIRLRPDSIRLQMMIMLHSVRDAATVDAICSRDAIGLCLRLNNFVHIMDPEAVENAEDFLLLMEIIIDNVDEEPFVHQTFDEPPAR